MTARKFKLFMCCQGNGTTLCNKAVYENHDYKTIGHISGAGNVKFYVKPGYIPQKDMECIQRAADHARNDFIDRLDAEIKYRPLVIYERMLDALSTSEYLDFQKAHKGDDIASKISALVPLYLKKVDAGFAPFYNSCIERRVTRVKGVKLWRCRKRSGKRQRRKPISAGTV